MSRGGFARQAMREEAPRRHPGPIDYLFRSEWEEEEHLGPGWSGGRSYSGLHRGLGQMKVNGVGWPTVDGKFVNYLRFNRNWQAFTGRPITSR
jgi:hypothetical protein